VLLLGIAIVLSFVATTVSLGDQLAIIVEQIARGLLVGPGHLLPDVRQYPTSQPSCDEAMPMGFGIPHCRDDEQHEAEHHQDLVFLFHG